MPVIRAEVIPVDSLRNRPGQNLTLRAFPERPPPTTIGDRGDGSHLIGGAALKATFRHSRGRGPGGSGTRRRAMPQPTRNAST